jgi:hypothetical protein
MEHVAKQLATEIDGLVRMYWEAQDDSQRRLLRGGCDYKLKQLRREGCGELSVKYEGIVQSLNHMEPRVYEDW